jgi:hypothetical protein
MKHTAVSSSFILSVGYDEDNQTLELTFSGGSTYSYAGVPRHIYEGLREAASKGAFYSAKIKGVYLSTKLGSV